MNWKERILKKKKELQAQYQRGKIVTEQIRAEKLRKKIEQHKVREPGTIRYAMATKQSTWDLMKDAKERRELKRKEKQNRSK